MQLQQYLTYFRSAFGLMLAGLFFTAQAQQAGLLYDPEPPADSAYVRVIVTSHEGALDVYVDGRLRIRKLASGEASEFMVLPAGPHTLALHPAGKPNVQLSSPLEVIKGRALTVAFTHLKPNSAPVVFEDKTNSNKLKAVLAVYHLDAKAGPLDILTADGKTKVFTGLSYGTPASIQVNPITVALQAVKADDQSARARASVAMTQGGTYSVFLLPAEGGKTKAHVALNKIERYTGK